MLVTWIFYNKYTIGLICKYLNFHFELFSYGSQSESVVYNQLISYWPVLLWMINTSDVREYDYMPKSTLSTLVLKLSA